MNVSLQRRLPFSVEGDPLGNSQRQEKSGFYKGRKATLLIKGGCTKLVQMTGVNLGMKRVCSKSNSLAPLANIGKLEVVFLEEDNKYRSCRHFFPLINVTGLSVKPSLIHSCIVIAQGTQRLEREWMWRNGTAQH